MAIELEIDTRGLTSIANWVDELAGDSDELITDILKTAGNYQTRSVKRNFGAHMGPNKVPWKPLKPLTKKGRKQGKGMAGRGYKRLLATGALRQGIAPATPLRKGSEEQSIKILTNQPYAGWQQEGFSSRIKGKQAWWMICNLMGYDPEKPEKFGEEAFGKQKQRTKTGKERRVPFSRKSTMYRAAMGSFGKQMAYLIWKKMVGSMLTIPPTPFMGVSTEDADEIQARTQRRIDKFLRKRHKL